MSTVIFAFLVHLGVGIAGTLLLVTRTAGTKFFRFNTGVAAVLLLSALAFHPEDRAASAFGVLPFGAVIVATSSLLVYWATVGRALPRLRPWFLWVTLLSGSVAAVARALDSAPLTPTLAVLSVLSSTLVLGSAYTAMSLGHWYLVLPSMPIAPLQRLVGVLMGSTLCRLAVVLSGVGIALATWESPSGASYLQYARSSAGVLLWQRLLFGLAVPLALGTLAWSATRIRATQSATGLLYVDFFAVLVGELLAIYLLLSTGVPM